MGRFCRDQPSLLEQLVDQLRHEAVSHSIVPLPVAEAADFKVFRKVQRNRSGDVEIGSLGSALLQDEGRDLLPLGFQCGAVFFVAQIGVFLIAVDGIASEGLAF